MNNKQKKPVSSDPLRAFYESYATPDRDMTTLEGAPRKIPPILVVGTVLLLALLAGASWVGYQFFSGNDISIIKAFAPRDNRFVDVKFAIDRESVVANGIITANLTIKNVSANPIDRLSATLTFPEGFTYLDANPFLPKNEQHTYWELGVLKGGEELTLAIRGRIDSPDESEKKFEATLYYQPVNLTSEFKADANATVIVKRSPFRLRIEGNDTVEQGKSGTFLIKYHESAEQYTVPDLAATRPLRLRLALPPNMEQIEINPKPTSSEYAWNLSELENSRDPESPETRMITLIGVLPSALPGDEGITAVIGYDGDAEFVTLDETVFIPHVALPEEKNLSLRVLVDGSDKMSLPLSQTEAGGAIHTLAFEFENKGTKTFLDTAVQIDIPASPYLVSMQDDSESPEDQLLSWDAEKGISAKITSEMVPILAALAPGEKGTVSVRVRTLDPIAYRSLMEQGTLQRAADSVPIRYSAEISGVMSPSGEKQMVSRSVAAKEVTLLFDSDTSLALRSDARKDPILSTTFEWTLENTRHPLSDITVKTTLPPSAVWSSQTSVTAGNLRYLPDTREVIWTINRLPEGVRAVSARYTVEGDFTSATVPKVMIGAKDTVTGGTISFSR